MTSSAAGPATRPPTSPTPPRSASSSGGALASGSTTWCAVPGRPGSSASRPQSPWSFPLPLSFPLFFWWPLALPECSAPDGGCFGVDDCPGLVEAGVDVDVFAGDGSDGEFVDPIHAPLSSPAASATDRVGIATRFAGQYCVIDSP